MPSAVQTAANDTKTSNSKEIEDKIARIRTDIADLGKAVASYGSDKADDLKAASEDALVQLKGELATLERQVSAHVRQNPLRSLALAAGAGVLIALIAKR